MGKYRFGSVLSALVIGAGTLSAGVGASVAQEQGSGPSPSAAKVECNKNHKYTFKTPGNQYDHVYLNVKGGSRKGAPVITWPKSGKPNEQWCLTPGPGRNGWNLRPWDNKNLCLDVPGARYKQGQGLIVWDCNNRKNQVFYVKPTHTDANYSIIGPEYGSGLKLHRGKYDASQVTLWRHLNTHAMWW